MSTIPTFRDDIFTDEVLLNPHESYRTLRELGPVVWLEAHQAYAVARYAEAHVVLADANTFCSGQGVALNDAFNAVGAGRSLIMTDGELHDHLRDVIGWGLTPRALRPTRETIEQLADDLVTQLVDRRSFDAVADLARALPLIVVPDLLGWPAGGREHLLEWAAATFDMLGPWNERAIAAQPKVQAMMEFTVEAAASGNVVPGSLGAAVIEAARRGELQPEQVPPLLVAYIAPSLDTTISAIGSAVWLLATHPDQWAALKSDPSLIQNAFNETVRIESPIRAFSRVTTQPTNIGGCELEAGVRLIVLYGSANRDDRHFEEPETFDVTRRNAAEHVGFGYGVHRCAGQGLARLEGQAVLQALVDKVDTVELVGQPVRNVNNLISAWATLPVTVTPV
jgi:cytochrome P450